MAATSVTLPKSVVDDFAAGRLTLDTVASMIGRSNGSAWYRLLRSGYRPTGRAGRPRKAPQITHEDGLAWQEGRLTTKDIAAKLGLTTYTALATLTREGWHSGYRARMRKRAFDRAKDIANEYLQGKTLAQIGDRLRISPERVRQIVRGMVPSCPWKKLMFCSGCEAEILASRTFLGLLLCPACTKKEKAKQPLPNYSPTNGVHTNGSRP